MEPFTGVVTCTDAQDAAAPAFCEVSMPVQGGLSGVVCGISPECETRGGDGGISDMNWGVTTPLWPDHNAVVVTLATNAPVDELGTFALTVQIQHAGGNQLLEWNTPAGTCSVTLSGSFCVSKSTKRVVSGTGHCTEPAAPSPNNPAAPITIGDFSFNGG
jgi:hypothetical protein